MGQCVEDHVGMITAKVVAHSASPYGDDIGDLITFELEYPRYIHAELLTHRYFSKNSSSSRAIPSAMLIGMVLDAPARPLYYAYNKAGMQAGSRMTGWRRKFAEVAWSVGAHCAAGVAYALNKLGVHKQWANRGLEPYQMMKVVLTSSEWNNFFHLRNHKDAQPEIRALARVMLNAMQHSTAVKLGEGDYHLPYLQTVVTGDQPARYFTYKGVELSINTALKVSASCCAQVSYRVLDDGIDKANRIYDRLVESTPVHASPFEHQAHPLKPLSTDAEAADPALWPAGATHMDRYGDLWSGNFRGWGQHRQYINNNVVRG